MLSTVLQKSATGATLLLMGLPYGPQPFSFESVVSFDRTIVGSVGSSGADFEEALRTLPMIDTTPFLQASLPLDRVREGVVAGPFPLGAEGHAAARRERRLNSQRRRPVAR